MTGDTVTAGDSSITKRLFVTDDVSMNGNLFVNNDISFNGNVNGISTTEIGHLSGITGNIQSQINNRQTLINANNKVAVEFINFNSDVTVNDKLSVEEDVSFNNRLFVNGDASINGDVTILLI